MSSSARKPSGPIAMLVGIPNKRFVGGLDRFLNFLLNIDSSAWTCKGKMSQDVMWASRKREDVY